MTETVVGIETLFETFVEKGELWKELKTYIREHFQSLTPRLKDLQFPRLALIWNSLNRSTIAYIRNTV